MGGECDWLMQFFEAYVDCASPQKYGFKKIKTVGDFLK